MSSIRSTNDMLVQGWEPASNGDDTDVGMTLGELPAGFCVRTNSGGSMMNCTVAAPRRLVPYSEESPISASSRTTLFCGSAAPYTESPTNLYAQNAIIPVPSLLTPPRTRSHSLVSSTTSMNSGTVARSAASSRGPAAAGVPRRVRSSTERKIERKRAENANYIPRPKNSFILFRTDFVARHKKVGEASGSTASAAAAATTAALLAAERRVKEEGYDFGGSDGDELEGASLSKQASEVWNRMSDDEKQPWVDLAEKEKAEHARRYPNYRYRPVRSGSATSIMTNISSTTQRSGKSLSPGATSARQTCPSVLTRSFSMREQTTSAWDESAAREREREETQKRRIYELMAQNFRGGEPMNTSSTPEGTFPHAGHASTTSVREGLSYCMLPSLPAASAQASIPFVSGPNTAFASQISSVTQPLPLDQSESSLVCTPPPAVLQRAPTTIISPVADADTKLLLHSSSSLAQALIPKTPSPPALPRLQPIPLLQRCSTSDVHLGPIPRTPSAPVFDKRALDLKEAVKITSPMSVSCPATPHSSLLAIAVDESPLSSSSSLPTHSMLPSPNDEKSPGDFASQTRLQQVELTQRSNQGSDAFENYRNDYVSMNEIYENYDSNNSLGLYTVPEHPTTSLLPSSCVAVAPPHPEQQRPLDAVATIWSRSQSATSLSSSQTLVDRTSFADQVQALPTHCKPAPSGLQSTRSHASIGLLSPPVEPNDIDEQRSTVAHPTPSLGDAACQTTDVGIEAYQSGLGQALKSSSESNGAEHDGSFTDEMMDTSGSCFDFFDFDFGTTVLPASTLSFSALGLYNSNSDDFNFQSSFE